MTKTKAYKGSLLRDYNSLVAKVTKLGEKGIPIEISFPSEEEAEKSIEAIGELIEALQARKAGRLNPQAAPPSRPITIPNRTVMPPKPEKKKASFNVVQPAPPLIDTDTPTGRLFVLLLTNEGKTLSRESVVMEVYGEVSKNCNAALNNRLRNLNQTLKANGKKYKIKQSKDSITLVHT